MGITVQMRKHASWVLAAVLLLMGASALAAEQIETPRMRRFGPGDGLPSRMVLALAQDRQGYVWAATSDGLARYDGIGLQVWQHLSLIHI